MGRIVTALVELADGRDFVAEIANLTPHSVFIHTKEESEFRAAVTVTFFSVSFRGELAMMSRDPLGWIVVFDADAEVRRRIEARIPEVDVLGTKNVLSFDESTLGFRDDEAHRTLRGDEIRDALEQLDSEDLKEALQSTGGIPAATTAPKLETAAMASEPKSEIIASELLDIPLEESVEVDMRTMPAVERPKFGEEARAKSSGLPSKTLGSAKAPRMRPVLRRRDLTRREDPNLPKMDATSIDLPAISRAAFNDIPVLAEDQQTVVFASPQQYALQLRTNIAHGAIVVRARPIPIGTEKVLLLSVPGLGEPYSLRATVILSTDDSIGLSIEGLDEHMEALEQLI